MPPLQTDRAPRACESCRKLKTRCYPSKQQGGGCLRCTTHGSKCSLIDTNRLTTSRQHVNRNDDTPLDETVSASTVLTDQRLARLEEVVQKLVDRMDSISQRPSSFEEPNRSSLEKTCSPSGTGAQDAPVFLIKDITENVEARHPKRSSPLDDELDLVSKGEISLEDAYQLLSLFRLHYGRWVNFDEDAPIEQLMTQVRASPLLLSSICVVAARHTPLQRASELASASFHEAKRLLQAALLTTPQPIEFFQAALVLSLWSTTVGQSPLSIDGWLLTSYTLQQGFAGSIATSIKDLPSEKRHIRACCTWNHICLAHLQYCVGTGRKPSLQEVHVDRCADVLASDISQFEMRMVAELRLYWIIVGHCCVSPINLPNIRTTLEIWKQKWSFLFDQPRSQFLEMGYNFALLLAHCRSLHSQSSRLNHSKTNEMMQRAQNIIKLAISNTDERTPHLTDHIWHIITFSAITLCQLLSTYESILENLDAVVPLRDTIVDLIDWLRSVGLASHISRVLAKAIAAYYTKCTKNQIASVHNLPKERSASGIAARQAPISDSETSTNLQSPHENGNQNYSLQDLAWTTFFDFNADTMLWPYNSELANSDYTPSSNESWAAFTYGTNV